MVYFSKVTAVVAAFSALEFAAALPTHNKFRGSTSFTVNQVAKPASGKPVNIAAQYANALAKYGGTVPANLAAAAANGSVVNNPTAEDEEYLSAVTVGSSTLHLDFDTGSSDLWVFSSQLPSSDTSSHSVYKPSSNATKLSGYTWSISYGDGSSASGDVYRDTVSVGGISTDQQAVEAAEKVSSEFVQSSGDGLLGLAFSSLNTVKPKAQTTFFDTVKSQLAQPLFAASLKHKAPGSYDFGKVDSTKYTGSLTYANVDSSQGFWMFSPAGYAVGTGSPTTTSFQAIVDTGTTLMLLSSDIVSAYYKAVSGATQDQSAGGYVFPCSATLPDFTVLVGSYKATVPGSLINFAPVSSGSSQCFGGLQAADTQFGILGDVFLKSQYVVFNSDGPKLGFAAQA